LYDDEPSVTSQERPGSAVRRRIYNPTGVVQVRAMKDVKDIPRILFQIAVTTGVLIALF
jgi:hypothetical protein